MSYIFAEKYALRAGYYTKHITFGAGADFYMFTVDYAADFSEIDLINRFMLTYRWIKKCDVLLKEAKIALHEEISYMKIAQEEFKKAKELYNKKEYLKATDKLSKVIVSYPNFESSSHFTVYILQNIYINKVINSKVRIVGSNATRGKDVCLCLCCRV